MKTKLAVLAALLLTACASNPEQARYEIADGRARWLDQYWTAKRACESSGGVIMQERHESCDIRGCSAERPEIRSRYWCVR